MLFSIIYTIRERFLVDILYLFSQNGTVPKHCYRPDHFSDKYWRLKLREQQSHRYAWAETQKLWDAKNDDSWEILDLGRS